MESLDFTIQIAKDRGASRSNQSMAIKILRNYNLKYIFSNLSRLSLSQKNISLTVKDIFLGLLHTC